MFRLLSETFNKLTTYFREPGNEEEDPSSNCSESESDDEGDSNQNAQETGDGEEYPSDAEGYVNETRVENKTEEDTEKVVPPVASSSSLSKEQRRFSGSGIITKIDPFRSKAEISSGKNGPSYEIDLKQHPHCKQQKGARVKFTVVQEDDKWKIESVELLSISSSDVQHSFPKKHAQKLSNKKPQQKQQIPSSTLAGEPVKTHICIVDDVNPDYFIIKFNKESFPVDNNLFSDSSSILKGDKLKLDIKIKNNDIDEIVSVNWENIGISTGKLEKLNEFHHVKDIVIFEKVIENSPVRIGDLCDVVFVSSCQTKSVKTFYKRALSIEKRKPRILNNKDFLKESPNSKIHILPNPMNIETSLWDDPVKTQFLIQNKENHRIILKYIELVGTTLEVCEFKINTGKQEGSGVVCVLGPGESTEIEIECKQKHLGHTTEICSFVFHDGLKIDRKISVNVKVYTDPVNFQSSQKSSKQNIHSSRLLAQERQKCSLHSESSKENLPSVTVEEEAEEQQDNNNEPASQTLQQDSESTEEDEEDSYDYECPVQVNSDIFGNL